MVAQEKAVLIDGNSMTYGWDFHPGLFHNGHRVSGVINFLINVRKRVMAVGRKNVLVAWDSRHYDKKKLFPEYKATRKHGAFDEEIWSEIDLLKEVLPMIGIKSEEAKGLEADQVIASYALYLKDRRYTDIRILSFDSDLYQLICDQIVVETRIGKVDIETLMFRESLSPDMFRLKKILAGDKSDNIPGIPKFNGHTLRRLVKIYGNNPQAIMECDELAPHRSQIKQNEMLVTLKMDVPVERLRDTWDTRVTTFRSDDFKRFCLKHGIMRILQNFPEWTMPFIQQQATVLD
jgi:DNA polymerase-1